MNSEINNDSFYDQVRRSLDSLDDPGRIRQLSRIETDLIRQRLRALYDRLSDVGATDVQETKEEKKVDVEFEVSGEPPLSPAAVEEKIQLSETDPVEIGSEELLSIGENDETETPVEDKSSGQPDLFSIDEKTGDLPGMTVAETAKEAEITESVAEKLQKQTRVNSLKNAIGINEKFFFINELFEGNLNEYNAAIESLDGLQAMEEATLMLEELGQKYSWEEHPEAAGQLQEFIEGKLTR